MAVAAASGVMETSVGVREASVLLEVAEVSSAVTGEACRRWDLLLRSSSG